MIVLSFLAALSGAGLVFWATAHGAGMTHDSAIYVIAAKNFIAGKGLTSLTPDGGFRLLSAYPPLYPAGLALAGSVSGSIEQGARFLNAALFGALLFLTGFWTKKLLPVLLLLFSWNLLYIHAMAWSEPLCLVCGFSGLYLLERDLNNGRAALSGWAVAGIAAAALSRYAGVAFVVASMVLSLTCVKEPPRRRMFFLTSVAALLPLLLWFCAVHSAGGGFAGRQFSVHFPGVHAFSRSWLFWVTQAPLMILPFLMREKKVLKYFSLFYFLVLVLSSVFWDANIPFDGRTLCPLYVAGVIASASLTQRPTRLFLYALLALTAAYSFRNIPFLRVDGLGYASSHWKESGTVRALKDLPDEAKLYSNLPEGVYLLSGRPACALPFKFFPSLDRSNPDYEAMMASLAQKRGRELIFIVFFDRAHRAFMPTREELKARLPLLLVQESEDGVIFSLAR